MSSRPTLSGRLSGLPVRLKSTNSSSNTAASKRSAPASRSSSPRPNGSRANMAEKDSKACLMLRTTVVKGRNLAAKDKGGTSDPYLVVTLGDAKEATSSISKTLNPEWNSTFELPIVGTDGLVLEAVCWDKDRFSRRDYMGEFDVALEEVFTSADMLAPEPKWYSLRSTRKGKKKSQVSGEIMMQFSLFDPNNKDATSTQIYSKFMAVAGQADAEMDDLDELTLTRTDTGDLEDEETDAGIEELDETGEPETADATQKRRRRIRLAKIRRKAKQRAFEYSGSSAVAGVLFLEVSKIIDLPPEKNLTRTSFDMDPFVVTSLGKKTYRTRVVRHNLNPVYEEKLVFQVLKHEVRYSVNFAVVDRDRMSGNDFVGTTALPLDTITAVCDDPDPETGLYKLPDIPDAGDTKTKQKRFRLPLSRSSSAQSLSKLTRPSLKKENSAGSLRSGTSDDLTPPPETERLAPTSAPMTSQNGNNGLVIQPMDDAELRQYTLPLELKNKDRWETKHSPVLYIRAKYMPYQALRQQFWRAMLKQYDADESGMIDKVELTTMLDNLGSTLHESTIDNFFKRFAQETTTGNFDLPSLTFDQAVICLEDQLQQTQLKQQKSLGASLRSYLSAPSGVSTPGIETPAETPPLNTSSQTDLIPAIQTEHVDNADEGAGLDANDLSDERGEEHVIEIRECPICHQPRLNKKSDADIITHIATCASQDWRQVNNIVMAGFVTSNQAQRKWYSKVVTKITYGGYRLGANSANILVQDRITGQINEERMSVYVRLGIRLLYKGLKSRDMEGRRIRALLKSLSEKQGRKYDDPASAAEIQGFINFHQLNMSEVLLQTNQFKNFNEFFYRALKPDARPCSAPDHPEIATSPADCRTVVFNTLDEAQKIWVKGRDFTVERLFGKAYPEDAKRYANGSFGIFRLAPQDYHRFHIPVDGILGEPRQIDGEYYTVNPMAIRSALDVYGENIRVLVPIDSEKHGRVMVVCVGAMMVGSTVITRKAGERVKRAEELGYFKFGGSTLLVLFEPGRVVFDQDLVDNSNGALETLVRVGMSVGHHPDHPPHTPDMRKLNPTMEEKQDAKRRIEGSLAPAPPGGEAMAAS
ncbi:hypothetical protein NA57DRAFT_30331 [Rhizodiscina lignyota]|uniref:Phosphatidylserine decarboxylase proenzyme 2 n=1 Tax=Rhizodiscina lignyota TaxID=1504668 RepID=A0A9P4MAS1_9PEZI|nr:hypothetical protein NA57DRAFT_30331 [Rhizodiscina lignyota]